MLSLYTEREYPLPLSSACSRARASKKVDFINLLDFVRVDSLQALQESFPDHPNYRDPNENNSDESHYHRSSGSGLSDMFD